MRYVDMYRKSNNFEFIKDIREEIVNYSYTHGILPTAKKYQMSRNTVKRLRKKYSKGGRVIYVIYLKDLKIVLG